MPHPTTPPGGREADAPRQHDIAALARALIPEFGPAATRRILRILANFGVLGGRPPSEGR